jgi:hypothetical protein
MSERLSSRAGIILVRKLDYTGRSCFTSKSGIKTGESILICDLHRTGSRSNRGGVVMTSLAESEEEAIVAVVESVKWCS